MNENLIFALNHILTVAKTKLNKLSNKKKKSQEEVWEFATLMRDITDVEVWIKANNK